MRDKLFLLKPGFDDGGEPRFCPYSAQVIGMLTYYPQLRETLDVVELPFRKPRHPVVDLLDDEHQSLPMLVLGDVRPIVEVPEVTIGEIRGQKFVEKTIEILRYLAVSRGVPGPHAS